MVNILRKIISGAAMGGILTPVIIGLVSHKIAAASIAVFGWFCFALIAALYPISVIISGQIMFRGLGAKREIQPIKFWFDLISIEAFLIVVLIMVSMLLHVYFINSI